MNDRTIPKEIETHPAFKGYNAGCCGRLVGRMAFVTVFISDSVSKWESASEMNYKQAENDAISFLMQSGGVEAGLRVVQRIYYRVALTFEEKREKYNQAVSAAIHILGFSSFNEMRSSVCKNCSDIDHVAVFFVFNKVDRSFASISNHHKNIHSTRRSHMFGSEYSVIYAGSKTYLSYSICHELLHLYGAVDYYYPETVKKEANKVFLHSIMLDFEGKIHIDEFTKFLIGWSNCLTPKSIDFLKNTISTRRTLRPINSIIQNTTNRRTVKIKGEQYVNH